MSMPTTSPRATRLAAATTALLCTLLAAPVSAGIAIPNTPLQAGSSVPPNIMFIMDTSGSMAEDDLFNTAVSISGGGLSGSTLTNVRFASHPYNTLHYNPAIDYQPWRNADGSSMAERAYTSAYSSTTLATTGGGLINLQDSVQTFYTPQSATSDVNDITQYYRYQILTSGSVVRSERLEATVTTQVLLDRSGLSAGRNSWVNGTTNGSGNTRTNNATPPSNPYTISVPAGVTTLRIRLIDSGNNPDANLYVRRGGAPTTATYDRRANGNSSNEDISIANPTAGTWYIGVVAVDTNTGAFSDIRLLVETTTNDANTGEGLAGCDTSATGWGWRNCVYTTPTGRSEADERQNFSNWYSFHRTRMKSAKAGVSVAFSDLGENFRVGLAGLGSISTRIPVATDGGLFRNKTTAPVSTNRTSWFSSMFALGANGYTPLRTALNRVGTYYTETAANGPYGGTGTTQLACRQNFAILTTDGYWNDDADSSFTSLSGSNSAGVEITGPNSQTFTYSPSRPYTNDPSQSSARPTLADIAMHYWKTDLRPGGTGLENIVPSSTSNPAFWQHMVTFGISLGLQGNLNSKTDLPAITAGTANWGTVSNANDENPAKIDDLWHAAVNSRGTFVAATDPQEFGAALRAALATVVERTASASNVAANSTSLTSDTRLFQARYVSGRWYGELAAYPASSGGIGPASWTASTRLPLPGDRNIITWNGLGGADFPTTAQSALLNLPTPGVTDYIRGDRSRESGVSPTGTFRARVHPLGDIIHSSPVYVKRTETIYVGANDGMLHAFNAANGDELFAYIPGNVDLASLKSLASENYAHAYFVDGPITVSDFNLTPNKNLLVGALGRGGRGVFGLDVSDPANFQGSNALWDYNALTHTKMGNVLSTPVITKLNNGVTGVLVANGPNSPLDTAVLYILNVQTGAVIAEIDTGTGTGWGGATNPNGLSGLRGWDADLNGTIDYVYAGDLRGNLWKFDISSTNPTNWTTAGNRRIVFTAVDSGGKRQPISGTPAIGLDPLTYNQWVFFGTGRYLNTDDVTNTDSTPNTDVQTWYGLIDNGTAITGRAQLQQRIIKAAGAIGGRQVRSFEANSVLNATARGWYIDLISPPNPPGTREGERMIGANLLVANTLIAASITPIGEACRSGGSGLINAIDAFTGSSVSPVFFDANNDGQFNAADGLTVDGESIPAGSLNLNVDMVGDPVIAGSILFASGSNAALGQVPVNLSEVYGRKSWREVFGE